MAAHTMIAFRPRLLDALRDYNRQRFKHDVFAGVTVGIVALPLAIGLGIASGVSPGAGIYTAIIGGLLVSALGGSRVQVGGPAGAFVGLVYAIIVQYGLPSLLVCTAMSGVMLFILGAARLGTLIKFIPHPVTTGFTCGVAVTIILSQVKDFFGLTLPQLPAEFFERIGALARALPSVNVSTVLLGVAAFAIIRLWPVRWAGVFPGTIVAVIAGTAAVHFLKPRFPARCPSSSRSHSTGPHSAN